MGNHRILVYAIAAFTLFAVSCSQAANLGLGDPAPDWESLPGVDGEKYSLSDFQDAKLTVLVFTCNTCPVATAYEDRLIELQKEFDPKEVQFIAVSVNDRDGDRLPQMKIRAEEKGFNFPYLYDASQKIGRDYGATVTPHVFLLDGDHKIAYIGAIDDNQRPERVTEHYLHDALVALLAGEKPPKEVTKEFGCTIKW